MNYANYFMDFDDTLIVGPVTWALNVAIPRMIRENHLAYDRQHLDAALLQGQQQASSGENDALVINTLFDSMGWPHHLKPALLDSIFEQYVPSLFEDALPFLERQRAQGHTLYVLSNNNHAPYIAQKMGIVEYFAAIFTPKSCGLSRGKPDRAIWEYIEARHVTKPCVLIGDDPWSDGALAEACDLPCILLDRMARFRDLPMLHPRVSSLNEIT